MEAQAGHKFVLPHNSRTSTGLFFAFLPFQPTAGHEWQWRSRSALKRRQPRSQAVDPCSAVIHSEHIKRCVYVLHDAPTSTPDSRSTTTSQHLTPTHTRPPRTAHRAMRSRRVQAAEVGHSCCLLLLLLLLLLPLRQLSSGLRRGNLRRRRRRDHGLNVTRFRLRRPRRNCRDRLLLLA